MKIFIPFFFLLISCSAPLIEDENFLESLMMQEPEKFADVLKNREAYEVQIIYTQINRDENNIPAFKTFHFNVDPDRYFYPASTVKFPASVLALEKINKLNIEGLDKYTPMFTDSAFSGQTKVLYDSTSANYLPSVAHYIRKIMIVSDNDAHNRLYEFLGQAGFNDALHEHGLSASRMTHRLAIFLTEEENRHTNPIRFVNNGQVLYEQAAEYNDKPFNFSASILKGKAYLRGDSLVHEPFDFTAKNIFPLTEQQQLLKAVFFPESAEPAQRFNLTADDYRFLYQYMSQLPTETFYPNYQADANMYDAYAKFLMYGSDKSVKIPKHLRIFNKIGQAYGYVTDNAYIMDTKNKIEFMLSATILANKNQTFNDGTYEYDEVALPFMKNLGQAIYTYELKRKRDFVPELSRYKVTYEE
ncbi:MAG TPA: serine hydrolase [Cyclobacteriaceae bacterium]|nr:serine hydrolase [Cyclobacteriaceae bacterium]